MAEAAVGPGSDYFFPYAIYRFYSPILFPQVLAKRSPQSSEAAPSRFHFGHQQASHAIAASLLNVPLPFLVIVSRKSESGALKQFTSKIRTSFGGHSLRGIGNLSLSQTLPPLPPTVLKPPMRCMDCCLVTSQRRGASGRALWEMYGAKPSVSQGLVLRRAGGR